MVRRRGIATRRTGPAAALATVVGVGSALATDTFPHYGAVPRIYTQDPSIWAELLDRAESETVRLAILGDSQETCPHGAGAAYVPALNYRFYLRYDNCPETTLASHHSTGADPVTSPAGWLWMGSSGENGGEPETMPRSLLPPGPRDWQMVAVPPQALGWYHTLLHDATNVNDTSIPHLELFRRDGDVRAELFALSAPESGEIAWLARPTDDPPEHWAPIVGSGTLELGLQRSGDPVFLSGMTPPLDYAGMEYMAVEAAGTEADVPTRFLGARFRNLSHPQGVVVQSFSAGGMHLMRLLQEHGGMGPCLRVLDYDAFLIQLGVNDAFSLNRTATQYRSGVLTVIHLLREAYDDPALPVAIAIDVHRADGTQAAQAEFDQQAGAAWAIAQADPNVLLLNMRRITEEDLGWGTDNEGFLLDFVHLTPAGQRTLAKKVVEALVVASQLEPVCPDPTGDGIVDVDDLIAIIIQWESGDEAADVNHDGSVDVDDILTVILSWGEC